MAVRPLSARWTRALRQRDLRRRARRGLRAHRAGERALCVAWLNRLLRETPSTDPIVIPRSSIARLIAHLRRA